MFKVGLLTLLLVASGIAWADYVCSVHDGDTFTTCRGRKVRLWGVDAPELKQPMGKEARDFAWNYLAGKDISLTCFYKSFDRDVCQVMVGKESLDHQLASNGYAYDSVKFSKGLYSGAEIFPRILHRGVWSLPNGGVRPWDYRHNKDRVKLKRSSHKIKKGT